MLTIPDIASCRTDLFEFSKKVFELQTGSKMLENYHQHLICSALEKVVIGDIKRLIINVPPRSGKTTFAVINFIAWCLGNFPDSEFIHVSYSSRLAAANTYKVRELMRHWSYQEIFEDVKISQDSFAKNNFSTTSGGLVYSDGAAGSLTGMGAGKKRDIFGGAIIIDDIAKPGEALSHVVRENIISWFSTTLESRKNSPNTPIIVIMQRVHDEDLSGFLLKGGNGEKWEHISIPAIKDNGESFWPEQFPIEDLLRLQKSDSYRFAGQYQQNPNIKGGNMIKTHWFKYYTQLPPLKYREIFADTAMKTKEHNDYSVFQCWGKGIDNRLYLIDMIRGKYEAPELERMAIAFWEKHNSKDSSQYGQLRYLNVEDKASGTGLIQSIKRKGNIPIKGIKRHTDKTSRLYSCLGFMESHYIILPENNAIWLADYLFECESFSAEGTHKHDDMVDTTIDAITQMLSSENNLSVWENII